MEGREGVGKAVDAKMKDELKTLCGTALFDEPLSRHTSVRIGGPSDALVYPKTIEEVAAVAKFCRANDLPLFLLGAGSNLLIRDKGMRGVVMSLSQGFGRIEILTQEKDEVILSAEAGVGLPRLVDFAAEEGFGGLEVLSGIPGNVGGALVMNAGTQDGDISQTVMSVTFVEPNKKGEAPVKTWDKEDIGYAYRESHFPRGAILLSARFKLTPTSSEKIRGKIQKYREYRLQTQPLNVPSLGSVFKNPVGAGFSRPGAKTAPLHAAKLIEDTGLKDVRVGRARISAKHANWIVNEGGATARDVLALIGLIKDKVKEKFGVTLETEVRVVGEE